MDYDKVISEFDQHIKQSGCGYFNEMYIGIAMKSEIKQKLFQRHRVAETNQWWIYAVVDSAEEAIRVKKHYLDLGMKGGIADEQQPDDSPRTDEDKYCVYCYKISLDTVE
jgi:hypothetical protein